MTEITDRDDVPEIDPTAAAVRHRAEKAAYWLAGRSFGQIVRTLTTQVLCDIHDELLNRGQLDSHPADEPTAADEAGPVTGETDQF